MPVNIGSSGYNSQVTGAGSNKRTGSAGSAGSGSSAGSTLRGSVFGSFGSVGSAGSAGSTGSISPADQLKKEQKAAAEELKRLYNEAKNSPEQKAYSKAWDEYNKLLSQAKKDGAIGAYERTLLENAQKKLDEANAALDKVWQPYRDAHWEYYRKFGTFDY